MAIAAEQEAAPREAQPFEAMKLQVGTRLQFLLERGGRKIHLFSTLIGYVPNEYLLAKIPMEKGQLFQFLEEERLLVRVFSGVQVFSFVCFVERLFLAGLNYMHLSFPASVAGTALRKAVRVQVKIPAQVATKANGAAAERTPATMVNVSILGALLHSEKRLGEVGDTVGLTFEFMVQPGDYPVHIQTNALIRAVLPQEPQLPGNGAEHYEEGVEFQGLDPTQLIMLQNLIYEAQVEDRRRIV